MTLGTLLDFSIPQIHSNPNYLFPNLFNLIRINMGHQIKYIFNQLKRYLIQTPYPHQKPTTDILS